MQSYKNERKRETCKGYLREITKVLQLRITISPLPPQPVSKIDNTDTKSADLKVNRRVGGGTSSCRPQIRFDARIESGEGKEEREGTGEETTSSDRALLLVNGRNNRSCVRIVRSDGCPANGEGQQDVRLSSKEEVVCESRSLTESHNLYIGGFIVIYGLFSIPC